LVPKNDDICDDMAPLNNIFTMRRCQDAPTYMLFQKSREEEWRRCRDEKRNGVEKQKREEERACLYTT